ncbi:MAG: DNA-binding protein YbiB [Burkholderiales bacterium]|nr:DNA-binding protein YbiB [Burkholderiales bacterium]MBH2016365.1 DNA-binding protein YbiB [Burkholderiales bacterium]
MGIASYIKEIGRGKDGARALDTDQARDLLSQVLDGQVTDLEVGAFCLAMRIKGETPAELLGFLQAATARCLDLRAALPHASRGVVLLPSYNGSRKLPNLTALLAWALARRGVGVLVHGPSQDPTRITTAQVFAAAGWPRVDSAESLAQAWQAGAPAFIDIATLCPSLARLLAVRWTIGLRNPGHTVAKLLDPFGDAPAPTPGRLRVINHTHPEYAESLSAFLQLSHANALLMRGTEGEPVADARRQPRFDVFLGGQRQEALSRAPQEGVLVTLPELPAGREADVTAAWITAVLQGQAPLPAAIEAQADCLVQALGAGPTG